MFLLITDSNSKVVFWDKFLYLYSSCEMSGMSDKRRHWLTWTKLSRHQRSMIRGDWELHIGNVQWGPKTAIKNIELWNFASDWLPGVEGGIKAMHAFILITISCILIRRRLTFHPWGIFSLLSFFWAINPSGFWALNPSGFRRDLSCYNFDILCFR